MSDPVTFTVYPAALVFIASVVALLIVGATFVEPDKLSDNAMAGVTVLALVAGCAFLATAVMLIVDGATP